LLIGDYIYNQADWQAQIRVAENFIQDFVRINKHCILFDHKKRAFMIENHESPLKSGAQEQNRTADTGIFRLTLIVFLCV
jgi:hypothetical protein